MTHPPIKAPFELPQTDTSAEETARRFVAEMPSGTDREKFEAWLPKSWSRETFKDDEGDAMYREDWVQGAWAMWCHLAALPHPAAQAGAVQAVEWIAVADRAPAPEVFVLCWDGKKTFVEWFGSKPDAGRGVTHWMPYPMPPSAISDMHDGSRALAATQPSAAPGDGQGATDELRAQGWTVAVHNDYRLNGEPHTFWLFTKGDRAIKGEGRTDADALAQVRAALAAPGAAIAAREQEDYPEGFDASCGIPARFLQEANMTCASLTGERTWDVKCVAVALQSASLASRSEAPAAFQKALDIRIAQGWQLGGNACPVLYTDTINGEQVCRDDLWLATTAGLKGAQPEHPAGRPTTEMIAAGMKRMFEEKRYTAPWDDVIALMYIDMVKASPAARPNAAGQEQGDAS